MDAFQKPDTPDAAVKRLFWVWKTAQLKRDRLEAAEQFGEFGICLYSHTRKPGIAAEQGMLLGP